MNPRIIHSIWLLLFAAIFNLHVSAQSKYLNRTERKLEKGDTLKAFKKLNNYIARQPKDADLYLLRAKLKVARGNYDPAMVDLNSYSSLNPSCTEASYWKGMLRYKQGDYHGAIEHFSAYTASHTDAEAWIYLGLSHMWLQHHEIAMNAFQRSLELNPNQVMAYYNAGLSAFRIGNTDRAVSHLTRAHKLDSNDTDILLALANSLTLKEDYLKSISYLNMIPNTASMHPTALFNIAVNHYRMGEEAKACLWWQKAMKVGHLKAEDNIKRYCEKK